jgi:hypothetical protein
MPIVDDQGRLFGRLNLVDAVVGLIALALIPLAYGAYVLFRTPAPRLLAIEPATMVTGPDLRVHIRGENLRPYMRVSFNDIQGNSFLFRNMGEALVELNPMPAGVYDVVLYDNAQERSRLVKAFTLEPPPLPVSQVMLVGTLGNLSADRAAAIKAGMTVDGIGEIVQVSEALPEVTRVFAGPILEIPIANAVLLPVVMRAACKVQAPEGVPQCAIGNVVLRHTSMVAVTTPIGQLPFQVDQIRGVQPLEPVQVTVQIGGQAEVVALVRKGDADYGQYLNPLAAGAVVDAVGPRVAVGPGLDRVDVTVTARAQRGSSSWTYAAAPLRAGGPFLLRTPRYELQGTVLRISPDWSAAPAGPNGASR